MLTLYRYIWISIYSLMKALCLKYFLYQLPLPIFISFRKETYFYPSNTFLFHLIHAYVALYAGVMHVSITCMLWNRMNRTIVSIDIGYQKDIFIFSFICLLSYISIDYINCDWNQKLKIHYFIHKTLILLL